MAINHADGQLFVSVPFYPIAAGVGAAQAGAGWFTVLFIPIGLAIGMGACWVGRGIVYSVVGFGMNRSSRVRNRGMQTVAVLPFFVLYMVLPIAIAWGGIFGVWAGSRWLVSHLV